MAASRSSVNRASRRRIEEQNARLGEAAAIPRVEYPIEIYYGWAATPAITARPNLQYIHNPGGVGANKDVLVLGLKTTISF